MPRKKTIPKSKSVKVQPVRSLVASTRWYGSNIGKLSLLAVIVTLPASFLRTAGSVDLGMLGSIAGLFLLLVLTSVSLRDKVQLKESLAKNYNAVSMYFLRGVGILLVLMVLVIPIIMSLTIMTLVIAQQVTAWPLVVVLGLAVVGFFGFLLVRFSLAGVALVDSNSTVVGSLKYSLAITKKRFFKTLMSWVVLLLSTLVVSGLIIQLILLIPGVNSSEFMINLLNGVLLMALLPIMVNFVVRVYQKLS